MPKRRTACIVAAAVSLALAIAPAAIFLTAEPNPVTPTNYARISGGMTDAEVEAILGPAGISHRDGGQYSKGWENREFVMSVTFDAEGRATGKACGELRRPTWVQRVKATLGL
jgi:hypothetical protein